MEKVDKILSPQWIYFNNEKISENYSIVISGNIIIDIIPTDEVKHNYQTDSYSSLRGQIMYSGLVHPHGCICEYLSRSVSENFSMDIAKLFKNRIINEEFVRLSTKISIIKLFKAGVSSFSDISIFPDEVLETTNKLGMKVAFGLPILNQSNNWSRDENESYKKCLSTFDKYKSYPNIRMFFPIFVSSIASERMLSNISKIVNELEMPVRLINDTYLKGDKIAKILDRLDSLNLINDKFSCVNCSIDTKSFIKRITEQKINIINSNITNEDLRLMNKDLCLCVYIDDIKINSDLNIVKKIEQNYFRKNIQIDEKKMLDIFISKMNVNAAKALNIYNSNGIIEIGKDADLVSVSVNKLNILEDDVAKSILTKSGCCQNLWVSGKNVIKDGKLITINENLLYDELTEWKNRIKYEH
tara:strand:- start:1157 stop:2398 length:1242 start_codon:yes stop_codon:yes gene_type:complete